MTERSEWEGRVGRKWADEWRRTDRSFAALTDRLLARVMESRPRAVLDVGCGAGELSLAVARSHPEASVVGIDVSDPLIEVARERGRHLANVSFNVADASHWQPSGQAPDLITSRHGVMFFANPTSAFEHLHAIASPGARLLFSSFRSRDENAWATEIMRLIPGSFRPSADTGPGPFAFADPDHVQTILSDSGWKRIELEQVDFAYVAGAGCDAVVDAMSYLLAIGPAARAVAEMEPDKRAVFVVRLEAYLGSIEREGIVAMAGAAWIVSASRN